MHLHRAPISTTKVPTTMTDSLNSSAQALCLLTSMFGNETALVEVDPAALLRSQQRPHPGPDLSVLPRCGVVRNCLYNARFPETTPSRTFALTDQGCVSLSAPVCYRLLRCTWDLRKKEPSRLLRNNLVSIT